MVKLVLLVYMMTHGIYTDHISTCMNETEKCPDWRHWDNEIKPMECSEGLVYTCMYSTKNRLYEGCSRNWFAKNNGKCPRFTHCRDGQSILGGDSEYKKCYDRGICPPDSNGQYYISEIYKYQECVGNTVTYTTVDSQTTVSYGNLGHTKDITEKTPTESNNVLLMLIIILVCVAVIVTIAVIAVCLIRRRRKSSGTNHEASDIHHKDEEDKLMTEQSVPSDPTEKKDNETVTGLDKKETPGKIDDFVREKFNKEHRDKVEPYLKKQNLKGQNDNQQSQPLKTM